MMLKGFTLFYFAAVTFAWAFSVFLSYKYLYIIWFIRVSAFAFCLKMGFVSSDNFCGDKEFLPFFSFGKNYIGTFRCIG